MVIKMKKISLLVVCLAVSCAYWLKAEGTSADDKAKSEAEKQAAQANPYANDLGPDSLPESVLSKYPKEIQAGYTLTVQKCTVCHSASRPLNSQFAQPEGAKKADREKALAALKKTDPELFKNKHVWQIESDIWQRYVFRMQSKPGCEITEAEAKQIYRFFDHDSKARKLGKNKAAWKAHREKLLADFKTKNPKRFDELYGGKK